MKTYKRVVPRDLFNEAKLLNCLGQLYLNAERLPVDRVDLIHDGKPFDIQQDPSSGEIFVCNVVVLVRHKMVFLRNPLNSMEKWPTYAYFGERIESVFRPDGLLTSEFLNITQGD